MKTAEARSLRNKKNNKLCWGTKDVGFSNTRTSSQNYKPYFKVFQNNTNNLHISKSKPNQYQNQTLNKNFYLVGGK